MVDVILVDCAFIGQKKIAEPLGICYLAAALRESGRKVVVLEPSVEGLGIEETAAKIRSINSKIIGLSAIRDENIDDVISLVNKIRKRDIKIFVGGHGPSIGVVAQKPIYLNLAKCIDGFVIGEGERSFVELVNRIVNEKRWKDCPGVAYINTNENLHINKLLDKIVDINSIPFMARDVLEEYIFKYGKKIQASILSSRGCAYSCCTYCSVGAYERLQQGNCSRYRTISNIIEEIKYVYRTYGVNQFNFEDDNFFVYGEIGKERIREFCEKVQKLDFKIEFTLYCRADLVSKDIFEQLKKSGLRGVFLGIESFWDKTLRFFNKGLKAENMINALDVLYEVGFSTEPGSEYRIHIGFIFWHPKLSIEEIDNTLLYIKKYHMPPKLLTRKLIVYQGCPIEKQLLNENLLEADGNKWIYKNKNMSLIERYICSFINDICEYRDKIRTIEKAANQFVSSKETRKIEELQLIRKYMDELCFYYVDEVVDVIKKCEMGIEELLEQLDNKQRNKVHTYIKENNVEEKVWRMQKRLKLCDNEKDLFRK